MRGAMLMATCKVGCKVKRSAAKDSSHSENGNDRQLCPLYSSFRQENRSREQRDEGNVAFLGSRWFSLRIRALLVRLKPQIGSPFVLLWHSCAACAAEVLQSAVGSMKTSHTGAVDWLFQVCVVRHVRAGVVYGSLVH